VEIGSNYNRWSVREQRLGLHDQGERFVKLSDALTAYLGAAASTVDSYAHQELHRFGRVVGLEKSVEALAPPEIAKYAEGVVAAGGDVHGRLTPLKEFLNYLKKQGASSHSLAPHVKIPRATQRAIAANRVALDAIPMTKEGIKLLQDEQDTLKSQRAEIVESIRLAAEDKDFRENAPLDAARENQGKAEARIRELEHTLRHAVIIDNRQGKGARVGNTVVLKDLTNGKNATYKLTDTAEADPMSGKISIVSPVGGAVVGCSQGDEFAVQTPKGERRYLVSSIKN
jgi:transcription elongation factor GreA